MKKGTVLYIDQPHPMMTPKLEHLGFDVIAKELNYGQLLEEADRYTGFVIRSRFVIDRALLDAATGLKFIMRIGAGMENIDLHYAKAKGVLCLNSPEGNADAVGEYVIGSLLSLFRYTKKADQEVREGIWIREDNRGIELNKKTVGIVGYGNMGQSLAKKLMGFGCQVLAYDKYKTNFGDQYAQEVDLPTLQQEADIVSVHIDYRPENFHVINTDFIENFKKNIFLVNTSRGKNLCTEDLVDLLAKGKVLGAVLDVLEYEDIQLKNKPIEQWDRAMYALAANPDVILSPHIAGQTVESLTKHVDVLINKLEQADFIS